MHTIAAPRGHVTAFVSSRLFAGLFMIVLGLMLAGGIGFANDLAVHNGAHDTRHAMGFPCH